MRLWSIHPKYLDAKGLVALWRETLLAQNVLLGKTKGYTKHPQLERFKETKDPLLFLGKYLKVIYEEAKRRNYNFNLKKICLKDENSLPKIKVNTGQLEFEFYHLLSKLRHRDKNKFLEIKDISKIEANPIFTKRLGDIENWEKV